MAQVKGIYGSGTESRKKKKDEEKETGRERKVTETPVAKSPERKTPSNNVPAQSTEEARREQRREQAYRAQQGKPAESASSDKKVEADSTQSTNAAKQEQLREQQYRREMERMAREQRAKSVSAKVAREEQQAAMKRAVQNRQPKQVSRPVTDEEFDRIWYEDDPRYQRAQKLKYLQREKTPEEAAFDLLWYEDDPDYTRAHRDADSARAEQRAAKDYRERQEKAQRAKDLSTQAAVDEKLAMRKALASAPDSGYTESEQEARKFWEWLLNNDSFYSPHSDLLESIQARKETQHRAEMAEGASTQSALNEKFAIRRREAERQNTTWGQNSQMEEEARKYSDGPAAFDAEGHINGQGHPSIGSMRFGNSDVKTSGCGAIAVYNVLRDLGNTHTTLSDVIQTAEKSGCMLAGGSLGMTAGQLSRLMDEYKIDHHEVDPWELDQRAKNGEIADGTKFVVAASNSSKNQIVGAFGDSIFGDAKFAWSMMGIHNYELVYSEKTDRPWVVYNMYNTSYQPWIYESMLSVAGDSMEQFIAVYEVEE